MFLCCINHFVWIGFNWNVLLYELQWSIILGGGAGGLYAGATAGGDVAAEAGIGGSQVVGGAVGGSFAGSSAGGVTKYVSKTVEAPVIVEHEIHAKPVVQKTYVERTVIPNYVEKKIQVPSYVEKTVRVPTVVEKTVRVAAPPTIIEKTVEIPSKPAVSVAAGVEWVLFLIIYILIAKSFPFYRGGGHVESVNVAHKSVTAHHGGGAFGGLFASAGVGGGLGAGAGIGGGGIAGGSSSGVYRAEITKVANPGFINDVFNVSLLSLFL